MNVTEGQGVKSLLAMLTGIAKRSSREVARSYADGLTDRELAAVMDALSAADVAVGGAGNVLCESAAARLRGDDVETFGSAPREERRRTKSKRST